MPHYLSLKKVRDEEGQDEDGFNAAMSDCAQATKLGSTRLPEADSPLHFVLVRLQRLLRR